MLSARDNLICLISDLHKDARGFRPRGMFNWHAMSLADLDALVESLAEEIEDVIEAEKQERIEEDRRWRDDVALGVIAPTPEVQLEPWEIWEAKAEAAGF